MSKPMSYERGLEMVKSGAMTQEGLQTAITKGLVKPPADRNYGADQLVWQNVLKPALEKANSMAKEHVFNVQGRVRTANETKPQS